MRRDNIQENRLLPQRRLSAPILPFIGGRSRTTQRGNNLGGRVVGKIGVKTHGRRLPGEKKSAMRKIMLAKRPHCGHGNRMSVQQYAEAVIATALHNGMTIEQIAKMDPKELAKAHLHTQNKATDAAAKQILAEMK